MTRKRITELLVIAGLFGLVGSFAEGRAVLAYFAIIIGVMILLTLGLLVCRAPLIIVHELGHALMTRVLSWHVRAIVIGIGPIVWCFQMAGIPVTIRRWPVSAFVLPEPVSLRRARFKYVLILLAGPVLELAMLPVLFWISDTTGIPAPHSPAWVCAAVILSVMVLYDVIASLVPYTYHTVEGTIQNDGRLLQAVLFAPHTVGLPSKLLTSEIAAGTNYKAEAFDFVRASPYLVRQRLDERGVPMHVRGQELCRGLRDLAIEKYGAQSREVLAGWGVMTNRDFGRIVFALVDHGWVQMSDADSLEDFTETEVFANEHQASPTGEQPGTVPT